MTTKSIKSVVLTVVEVLKAMENQGVRMYEKLPDWLERPILHIIAFHGIQPVLNFINSKDLDSVFPLIHIIQTASGLQLDGS